MAAEMQRNVGAANEPDDRFLVRTTLDLVDSADCCLVSRIAAQAVHRVGRIDDEPALTDDVPCRAGDKLLLVRVVWPADSLGHLTGPLDDEVALDPRGVALDRHLIA